MAASCSAGAGLRAGPLRLSLVRSPPGSGQQSARQHDPSDHHRAPGGEGPGHFFIEEKRAEDHGAYGHDIDELLAPVTSLAEKIELSSN